AAATKGCDVFHVPLPPIDSVPLVAVNVPVVLQGPSPSVNVPPLAWTMPLLVQGPANTKLPPFEVLSVPLLVQLVALMVSGLFGTSPVIVPCTFRLMLPALGKSLLPLYPIWPPPPCSVMFGPMVNVMLLVVNEIAVMPKVVLK